MNRLAGGGARIAAEMERSALTDPRDPRSCRFPAKGTEWGRSGDGVGTESGRSGDGVGTESGRSGDGVGTESWSDLPPAGSSVRRPPPRRRVPHQLASRRREIRPPGGTTRSNGRSVSCVTSVDLPASTARKERRSRGAIRLFDPRRSAIEQFRTAPPHHGALLRDHHLRPVVASVHRMRRLRRRRQPRQAQHEAVVLHLLRLEHRVQLGARLAPRM